MTRIHSRPEGWNILIKLKWLHDWVNIWVTFGPHVEMWKWSISSINDLLIDIFLWYFGGRCSEWCPHLSTRCEHHSWSVFLLPAVCPAAARVRQDVLLRCFWGETRRHVGVFRAGSGVIVLHSFWFMLFVLNSTAPVLRADGQTDRRECFHRGVSKL